MKLYCIKTHSQRVVVEGEIYPLISDKGQCKCSVYDVGVKRTDKSLVGQYLHCKICESPYIATEIHYISKKLFANIDDISISEAMEEIKEKELV